MSSIVAREFDAAPVARKVFVNRVLDHFSLRVQPTAAGGVIPPALQIPADFECTAVKWVSQDLLAVLFANKEDVWIVDANLGTCVQTIKLKNSGACVDAVSNVVNGIANVWFVDSNNRIYHSIIENGELQEIANWKIDSIIEPISKMSILNNGDLLLVSNSIYLYNLQTREVVKSLNLFVDQCACIQIINNNKCLVSSKNDRFINLIDIEEFKVKSIFSLNEPCIHFQYSAFTDKSILAALNERGDLEIVMDPLNDNSKLNNTKRRRQQVRSVQPQYTLKLSEGRFDTMAFNGREMVLSYFENESFFVFDNYNWVDNLHGEDRDVPIQRLKPLNNKLTVSNDDKASFSTYSEGKVVVGTSDNLLDVQEDNESEDEEEEEEDFGSLTSKLIKPQTSVKGGNKVQFAVGTLSMNLVQALKTSDNQAFNTLLDKAQDEQVIRSTVAKLDIHYVMKLLDKLGELNYRNKFQALDLNVWIKYLLIFHGNYIVGVPHLKSKLTLLTISLKNRANTMEKLLELKGKLSITTERVEALREIERFESAPFTENLDVDVEYYEELEESTSDVEMADS